MTEREEALEEAAKAIERANAKLPGIEVPTMGGDNLAVTLCSHFCDGEDSEDDHGWSPAAIEGETQTINAIRKHYADAIRALKSSPPPKGGDEDNSVAAGAAPRAPAAEAIEVMARALFDRQHNGVFHGGFATKMVFGCARITYDEVVKGVEDGVYTESALSPSRAEAAATLTALQASGMAVFPRAEIEEARARFAEIRLLLPDGRACELAGAGAWDLNHILTVPKDGKSERLPAAEE